MDASGPRILVIHRDRTLSEAITCSIEPALKASVIAAVACEDAVGICAYACEFQPDIIVLNASGFRFSVVLEYLRTSSNRARVLVCGLRNSGSEILEAIEAGAAGCETVDGTLTDLVEHVQVLSDGGTICPPRIATMLFREVATQSETKLRNEQRSIPQLTRRERQIVSLVEFGLSNKQIATQLSLSPQTVKNHVHNILEKLQLRCRAEAAHYARENGLLINAAHQESAKL